MSVNILKRERRSGWHALIGRHMLSNIHGVLYRCKGLDDYLCITTRQRCLLHCIQRHIYEITILFLLPQFFGSPSPVSLNRAGSDGVQLLQCHLHLFIHPPMSSHSRHGILSNGIGFQPSGSILHCHPEVGRLNHILYLSLTVLTLAHQDDAHDVEC